jgi:hypothetical protein
MDLSSSEEDKAMIREAAAFRRLPPSERCRQVVDYFDDQKAMLRSAVKTVSEEMTRPIFDSHDEAAWSSCLRDLVLGGVWRSVGHLRRRPGLVGAIDAVSSQVFRAEVALIPRLDGMCLLARSGSMPASPV